MLGNRLNGRGFGGESRESDDEVEKLRPLELRPFSSGPVHCCRTFLLVWFKGVWGRLARDRALEIVSSSKAMVQR